MARKDFNVIVSKEELATTSKGFSRLLLLDDKNEIPLTYIKRYEDIKDIEVGENGDVKKMLEDIFKQSLRPEVVLVAGSEGDLVELFEKVFKQDGDFFYVATVGNVAETNKALAQAVVERDKMFGVTVATEEAGTAFIESIGEAKRELLAVGLHEKEDARLGQLLLAKAAGVAPGKATMKFQNIMGIGPSKYAVELEALHEKGMFTYKKEQKRLMTSEGIAGDGEYLDVVIGKYFIKTRIEEDASELAYTTANRGSKITYDDDGIAQLVGVVSGVGDEVADNDLITEYDIDFKRRAETSVKDRANRFYNGINARFELKGAIHEADFYINLAY